MIDATKILIEGALERALRGIAQDSRRSLRNLVDLGLIFAKSPWQQYFLQSAQSMLADETSAYYDLARRLESSVEHSRLKTFGVSLGYESCTKGARRIREIERTEGFDVPWMLTIYTGNRGIGGATLRSLISQGKELGIFFYVLMDCGLEPDELRQTLEENPSCAFLILLEGGTAGIEELETLSEYQNFMVSINGSCPEALEAAEWFRDHRFLYGQHVFYDGQTAQNVVSPEALERYLDTAPAGVFLIAQLGTPLEAQQAVAQQAVAIRKAQQYPYLLLEATEDTLYFDQIISKDDCALVIRPDGQAVRLRRGKPVDGRFSVHALALRQILRQAAPKR